MGAFADQVKRWAEKTKRNAQETVEQTWFELTTQIIVDWPVGDPASWANPPPPSYVPGLSVNNWWSSINNPEFGSTTFSGLRKENPQGSESTSNAKDIQNQVYGNVAYFINPTPYARVLEYGYSPQAPRGVVRLNVQRFKRVVKEAAKQNAS